MITFNDNLGFFATFSGQDLSERDPKASKDAFEAFKTLVNRFPDSKYAPDATDRMRYIVNSLAESDVNAARYYFRRGAYLATINRAQNAIKDYNTETFKQLNLAVTYVQFTDQSHIVWIGPFEKASDGLTYINKVKPRLSTEIISFIAKKQYDLTLIGKSNIVLINNQEQLEQYKRDKSNYYFKP